MPLIEESNLYDYIRKWSCQLANKGVQICGYVIMPNHIHLLVYITGSCRGLNYEIGEAKRFMIYEVVKRLKVLKKETILKTLSEAVSPGERRQGKQHHVFKKSFDAKEIEGEKGINRVLEYMHVNPVNGVWSLVDDYRDYPYSSVGFYLNEVKFEIPVWDYRKVGEVHITDKK